MTKTFDLLDTPWLTKAGTWEVWARPLDGGPSVSCADMWSSDDPRCLEYLVNEANTKPGVDFNWWVRPANHKDRDPS